MNRPAAKSTSKRAPKAKTAATERNSAAAKESGARKPAAKKSAAKPGATSNGGASVAEFMNALEHPLKREVEAIRKLILAVSPAVREEIKWNAPSFFTSEHFATFNLRARDQVRLILHLGAKSRASKVPMRIADPAGLLEWLGSDRAMVTFAGAGDVKEKGPALSAILAAWLDHL